MQSNMPSHLPAPSWMNCPSCSSWWSISLYLFPGWQNSAANIAPVELSSRLELLKSVVYTEGNLGWGAAKSLYAAVLRKIELGVLGWGDDFSGASRSVLERSLRKPDSSRRLTASKSTSPQMYYCRLYQSGKCDKGDSHEDTLPNGQKVTVTPSEAISSWVSAGSWPLTTMQASPGYVSSISKLNAKLATWKMKTQLILQLYIMNK